MSKYCITHVTAREIIDCRGWPTVQADVWVNGCFMGRADVAAGRSTGTHEAYELRDGDSKRYKGLGVMKAVKNVKEVIGPALEGMDVTEQRKVDRVMIELDGTANKLNLGANAIVAVSLAVARAAASACRLPLYRYLNPNSRVIPVPLMNFINGGKLTANELEIQEFILMPIGAESYRHALQITTEINEALRELIIEKYGILATSTGDEGGFAAPMRGIREPFNFLARAVEKAGYKAGFDGHVVYALDCAANSWYDPVNKVYVLEDKEYSREALIDLYREMAKEFPIASIEDPLQEEDFEGFSRLTRDLGIQIVGDDLFVTNIERIKKGIEQGAGNALLFKVNQIGTLSEAFEAAEFAYRNRYGVQVSERSGETEDPIISDLVVALNSGQIKTGMPIRGERTAKHNRLLQIEEELGGSAIYAGREFIRPF